MKYQPFRDRYQAVQDAALRLYDLLVPFVPEIKQVAGELAAWPAPWGGEQESDRREIERVERLLAACEEVLR